MLHPAIGKILAAALGTTLVLAGCAHVPSTAPGSSTPPAASSRNTPPPTLAVHPARGDATVMLHPVTYPDSGSPCAGLASDTPFAAVPASCQALFATVYATLVPGQSATSLLPFPTSASVGAGISNLDATAIATAFDRSQALTWWAAFHNQLGFMTDLDGASAGGDSLLSLLRSGAALQTPPSCLAPTSLTVVTVRPAALTYLEGHGWSAPSTRGVVATYPACAGVKAIAGVHSRIFGVASSPYSVLVTGSLQSDPLISTVWVTDGVAQCGIAAIRATCSQ